MRILQVLFSVIALTLVLGACAPAVAPTPAPAVPTAPSAPPTAVRTEPTAAFAPPTASPPEPTQTATMAATETPLPPSPAPPTAAPTTAPATAESAPTLTQEPPKPAGDPAVGGRGVLGKQLWAQKPCQGCHGANAEGGIGPTLAGTTLPFDRVLRQVRRGGGPMPAFAPESISDQELQNIYAWLQSLPGQ